MELPAAAAADAGTCTDAVAAALHPPVAADDHEDEEEGALCSICLEVLGDDGSSTALGCSHRFHASCIVPWLQKGNRSCPTCRDKPPRQRFDDGYGSEASYDSDPYEESGGNPYYDSEEDHAHQELHDEWNRTWSDWVERYNASERAKKKAITTAKRLASAKRPRDAQQSREAKKLLRSLESWNGKAKERNDEAKELEKEVKKAADEQRKRFSACAHPLSSFSFLRPPHARASLLRLARVCLARPLGRGHPCPHARARATLAHSRCPCTHTLADANFELYMKESAKLRERHAARIQAIDTAIGLPKIHKAKHKAQRAMDKARQSAKETEVRLARLAGWTEPGSPPRLPEGLMSCLVQPTGPPYYVPGHY